MVKPQRQGSKVIIFDTIIPQIDEENRQAKEVQILMLRSQQCDFRKCRTWSATTVANDFRCMEKSFQKPLRKWTAYVAKNSDIKPTEIEGYRYDD